MRARWTGLLAAAALAAELVGPGPAAAASGDVALNLTTTPATVVSGSLPQSVIGAFDLDHDGRREVLVQNPTAFVAPEPPDVVALDVAADGTVTERPVGDIVPFLSRFFVRAVGDFDGDGALDLFGVVYECSAYPPPPIPARRNCLGGLTGPNGTVALAWSRGTGSGTFGPAALLTTPVTGGLVHDQIGTAVADLDADGADELILLGGPVSPVPTGIYRRFDFGHPMTVAGLGAHGTMRRAFTARLDGDLRDDLVALMDDGVTVSVLAASVPSAVDETPDLALAERISFGDVDGDGRADLVASQSSPSGGVDHTVYPNRFTASGDPVFANGTLLVHGQRTDAAIGDLNGDGRGDLLEVVVDDASNFVLRLHRSTGVGPTEAPEDWTLTPAGTVAPIIIDLDGDGDLDVYMHNNADHIVALRQSDDGDGIDAAVDPAPGVPSNAASDGTTTLTIVDRSGLTLQVSDAPAPAGLRVRAGASGTGVATVDACGYLTFLSANDDVTLTCGSITAQVATGPVEIALPGGAGSVVVATGGQVRVAGTSVEDTSVTVLTGTATVQPLNAPAVVLTSSAQPRPLCNGRVATIVGTEQADKLTGTSRADVIVALGGDDKIEAGGGDDVICAGGGNDRVEAGDGNDVVFAGDGDDRVEAGAGNDVVDGGMGDDRIEGGSGNDHLFGGSGTDRIEGGGGTDVISSD